jgi:hypothetical protein
MEWFMELTSQDLLGLFKRVANPEQSWTYAGLGGILGLSASRGTSQRSKGD